jgi:hypothetical protein
MELELKFDISHLLATYEHLASEIEKAAGEAIQRLTVMAHANITEQAQEKLHSLRQLFFSKFPPPEQIDENTWKITIPGDIKFIEDGLNSGFDLLPGFLASPKAKIGKNGKYLVIPFQHNKIPQNTTPTQAILAQTIKAEMTKRKIPHAKIETNPDGSAKLGLLHKFNLKDPTNPPNRPSNGKPWQPDTTQKPLLWGVRIYQREHKNAQGVTSVKKSVMTFRTASEHHSGQKWIHPGLEPQKFLDKAKDWAEKEWEERILPDIMKDLGI